MMAMTRPTKDEALGIAAKVLQAYPTTELVDPKGYVQSLAELIQGYDLDVIHDALHPRYGLQTKQKWLPSLSEVREACDKSLNEKNTRARRAYLNEHHVLIDTHKGRMPEPDAERLRLGKQTLAVTDALQIAGQTAGDDSRTYSASEWIDRALGWLYTAMARPDREAGIVRKPGTSRARVDLEQMIKRRLGGKPEMIRSLCQFFAAKPDVYHEVVEEIRKANAPTAEAWNLLCERLHEHHSAGIDFPRAEPANAPQELRKDSLEARARAVAYWEELRPTFARPERQRKGEPPPGLTDKQRKEWYAQRSEAHLNAIKARNEASPVVIDGELARKLAAARAEQGYGQQEAAE
jgi:hypothetical protein